MSTASIIHALNKPLFTTRSTRDHDSNDIPERRREGIILQPWMVALLISTFMSIIGFAVIWGSILTRVDALTTRVERIERQIDADNTRTRGPVNHQSPPIGASR